MRGAPLWEIARVWTVALSTSEPGENRQCRRDFSQRPSIAAVLAAGDRAVVVRMQTGPEWSKLKMSPQEVSA